MRVCQLHSVAAIRPRRVTPRPFSVKKYVTVSLRNEASFMPISLHRGWCQQRKGVRFGPWSWGGLAMLSIKKLALYFLAALVLAGAYGALRNLPVLSGCNFYSECPSNNTEHASQ
jgi:hypothetical protein